MALKLHEEQNPLELALELGREHQVSDMSLYMNQTDSWGFVSIIRLTLSTGAGLAFEDESSITYRAGGAIEE